MWWVKYRHKFSSGESKHWEWSIITQNNNAFKTDKAAEVWVKEHLCPEWVEEYNYSEHYRGIDFEVTQSPPVNVIESKLQEAKDCAASWNKRVRLYSGLLKKIKNSAPNKVTAELTSKCQK